MRISILFYTVKCVQKAGISNQEFMSMFHIQFNDILMNTCKGVPFELSILSEEWESPTAPRNYIVNRDRYKFHTALKCATGVCVHSQLPSTTRQHTQSVLRLHSAHRWQSGTRPNSGQSASRAGGTSGFLGQGLAWLGCGVGPHQPCGVGRWR